MNILPFEWSESTSLATELARPKGPLSPKGPVFLCARLSSALREKRLVLMDQDGSGPGGSNQMSAMVLYALLSIMLYMA
jgi:hypothetical protein